MLQGSNLCNPSSQHVLRDICLGVPPPTVLALAHLPGAGATTKATSTPTITHRSSLTNNTITLPLLLNSLCTRLSKRRATTCKEKYPPIAVDTSSADASLFQFLRCADAIFSLHKIALTVSSVNRSSTLQHADNRAGGRTSAVRCKQRGSVDASVLKFFRCPNPCPSPRVLATTHSFRLMPCIALTSARVSQSQQKL